MLTLHGKQQQMIYPDNFDDKTGFTAIRNMVSELCISGPGRRNAGSISFLVNPDDIRLRLLQTEEYRRILLFDDEPSPGHIGDGSQLLKKLRIEGAFLDTGELFDLKRSLDTARGVINWFRGKNSEKYPVLASLAGDASLPVFVMERLNALLTKEGRLKDNASPGLQSVRSEITARQAAVSKRMISVLKAAQKGGLVEQDATVSIRNGRPVIPVSSSLKRKIKGFVHDESASGKTAYVEPAEVVELNNEIRELEYAEKREVIRILKEFAVSIAPWIEELTALFYFLGLFDFIRAKALFALKVNGVMPVLQDTPVADWKDAVHPLLFLALKREGRETVPLDLRLNGEGRIIVISGPNAGGKSVCLQTAGLLQYMLQCGMLVPMSENSVAGIFSGIFIDIGDEQSIENDLSTYSSHLINMKFFLRYSGPGTLILIDEFGAGTEPMLGGSVAEAILEQLNNNKTFGVITTHYTNLKHFAASTKGVVNGAMMYDTGRMEPLFRLETGKPGSSFAFEIARKIGLPEQILESAALKAGEDHIDFDRHLKDIIRDKHYWERKRKNIRQMEKRLEQDIEKYSSKLGESERERKEIIARAREEARMLLEGVNKRIENTIMEIRESQADKERTRKARADILELRKSVEQEDDPGQKAGTVTYKSLNAAGEDKKIRKGDHVRMFGREMAGEVMDVNGKSILVAFGNMITTVRESRLEKLSPAEMKKIKMGQPTSGGSISLNIREKKLNFKAERDVRGLRADESLDIISRLIDDALMVNARQVRILHGKGNGILRQVIRDYLATVPVVSSYRDEQVELGGSGITVVEFET
jgi:DNA mismatch repair protein MutS2